MKTSFVLLSKKIFQHELVNGSFYVILISNISNIIAFLFNLFLTRRLTYAEYGIVTSLISFIGLITIPSQSISIAIIQFASSLFSKNQTAKAKKLYKICLKYIFGISTIIFVLLLVTSKFIGQFMHINNFGYLVVTACIIGVMYFSLLNNAFLQSLLRFRLLSVLNIIATLVKFLCGVLLITMGFKVYGVLFAIFLSVMIPMILSFFPLSFLFKNKEEDKVTISKKNVLSYLFATAVATISLSSFISTDIILVKHFFNPYEAGLYAGLSLVGKVIFYLTAPIPMIMFPVLIKKYNQGYEFKNTFYLALLLVLLPSLAIAIVYYTNPFFIITLFLGGKGYLQISPYLWLYAVYIGIYSLINICVTFFLSLKKTTITYFVSVGAVTQIILISIFHANFFQVIFVSLLNNSVLFLLILLYYVKYYGNKKNQKATYLLNNSGI